MTESSFGYGWLDFYTANDEFNTAVFTIRQIIARLDFLKVVQVLAVHGGGITPTGTVDVMPLVSQIDGNGNSIPHGTVFGIPYVRIQGGLNAVICDPVVGDIGYIAVSDRDFSSVKSNSSTISGSASPTNKNQVTPGSLRQLNLADGIYVGGILNKAPKQYIQFTQTGITIVDMNGNKIQMSSSGTTITGNLIVSGTITSGSGGADSIGLQTHTHSGVTAGGGTSGPPVAGT